MLFLLKAIKQSRDILLGSIKEKKYTLKFLEAKTKVLQNKYSKK